MSTNYYAHFKLGDSRDHTGAIYKIHICKGTWQGEDHGFAVSTMAGKHFPDLASWIGFLRHNVDCVEVVDEYGTTQELEEFIEFLSKPGSGSQEQWLRDHEADESHRGLDGESNLKIWDEPQPDAWRARYWMDSASGKLFYSGEFF